MTRIPTTNAGALLDTLEREKGFRFPPLFRGLCETHGSRHYGEERWDFVLGDGSSLRLYEQEGWEPTFLQVTRSDSSNFFFVQLNPSSPAYGRVWWMDHLGPARRRDQLVANSLDELFEAAPAFPPTCSPCG